MALPEISRVTWQVLWYNEKITNVAEEKSYNVLEAREEDVTKNSK